MRRRQGFTLVELLVAMALIIFIMAILSQAFGSAMATFRNLKAAGDMAEKLRATTQLLQRDLGANHFEGNRRLSDPNFWSNGPPQQGFFQVYHGTQSTSEGADTDGIGSFLSTTHTLACSVKLRGTEMGNYLSASAPLLNLNAFAGPLESRYQPTSGGAYNYYWAEVAWFLQQQGDTTVSDPATNSTAVPLYTLYRRQRLAVPDNSLVTPAVPYNNGNYAQCLELSCWNNNGNLYFNSPMDLTDPLRRFGSGKPWTYTTFMQDLANNGATNPTLAGADIQLNDVVSFDVRLLTTSASNGNDPFVELWMSPFNVLNANNPGGQNGGMNNGNMLYYPANQNGPLVFDTWTSLSDGLTLDYSNWSSPGNGTSSTSIPLWSNNTGPTVLAVQVTIRIWDYRTNQTRQVTVVQAL